MNDYKGCNYCLHYRPDGTCAAFDPGIIPLTVVSGQTKHIQPLPNQGNAIVYEPAGKSIFYRLDEYWMKNQLMSERIELIEGDIIQPATSGCHSQCFEEEWLKLKVCMEGNAKITKGYNLSAKWVIHTVEPVWEAGSYGEDKALAQCYRNCFALVELYKVKTVAFPSISTGAYGFPVERAAKIAVTEARRFLEQNPSVEKIMFVCYEKQTYDYYTTILGEIMPVQA